MWPATIKRYSMRHPFGLYRPPSEASLFNLGPEMLAWLSDTELDLWRYTKEEDIHLIIYSKSGFS